MNSGEIINVINYLDSIVRIKFPITTKGLILSNEIDNNIIECPISQQSFILLIAQMLKRKASFHLKSK